MQFQTIFAGIFRSLMTKRLVGQVGTHRWALFFVLFGSVALLGPVTTVAAHVPEPATGHRLALQSAGPSWYVRCVDCPLGGFGTNDRSLRLDTNDRPHIAFGGEHLYYAWHDDLMWHVETADDASDVGSASLDLDTDGDPHITYYDFSSQRAVKYAYRKAGVWTTQTVEKDLGLYGGYTSLALDKGGTPHISYYDGNNGGALRYASLVGSTWFTQTVETGLGSGGGYPSLALDSADNPCISYYYDGTTRALKYACWTGSIWSIQTVETGFNEDISLVFDSTDKPHLSYYNGLSGLKYAHWTGTTWITEAIDNNGGEHTSLALDSEDHPHISYSAWEAFTPGITKYAHYTGAIWITETVDSEPITLGAHSSLALDHAGNPHMSFAKYPNDYSELIYASKQNEVWNLETVVHSSDLGQYNSLALDSVDNPHISYLDTYSDALKYAHWTGSEWAFQVIDSGPGLTQSAIALDSANNPYVIYIDNDSLKYAYLTGSDWITQTVALGGVAGTADLALDTSGNPHISYYSTQPGHGLEYAYWTGSTWLTQTVESDAGLYTSIALDKEGKPHISYCSYTVVAYDRGTYLAVTGIKYARWTGSTWITQTVDTNIYGQQYATHHISIALNSTDIPYIAYSNGHGVMNAYWAGNTWVIQTVADWGEIPSLGIDHANIPHIAYQQASLYPYTEASLKYASWTGSTWASQIVASGVDRHFALALDSSNNPRISYYDYSRHGLMYAGEDWPWNIYLPLIFEQSGAALLMHLDEPAGATTFKDDSGNGNDGSCVGSACPVTGGSGFLGAAAHFDGIDDTINLGNPPNMNLTGKITLEAWVKLEATDGIRNIIAHGYTTSPNAEVFLRVQNGVYEVGSWDGVGHKAVYAVPVEDIGQWVYLVGTYDGIAWRLYRNGLEVSSAYDSIGSVSVNGNWAVGAHGDGTERFFQGTLDEISVYFQALSAPEVMTRYRDSVK